MHHLAIKTLHDEAKQHNRNMKGVSEIENNKYDVIYSEQEKVMEFGKNRITLETTPCNYGGERYWFLCPYCAKRKAVLLLKDDTLVCRKCLDIGYYSLRFTKTDCYYYFMQAKKVAMKLDPSFEWSGWIGDGDFPNKPKNMHHITYGKLWRKYYNYCAKGEQMFMKQVGRITR